MLDGAAHVYVAARARRGPHVTPELFTISGERLVCMTAASTLKAEHAAKEPIMGLAARSPAGEVAAVCRAEVLDLADPATLVSSPASAVSSPIDVARFVRDNAAELTGATADALLGRLGVPPKRRVVLALEPIALAVEVDGEVSADGWDTIPTADGGEATSSAGGEALDGEALPPDLQRLLGAADPILGWTRRDGTPLALPARWDGTVATVSRALFSATGASPASAGCLTVDAWTGFGPSGKQGIMLRGHGEARQGDETVEVTLDVERATYWDGIETATIDAGEAG